VLVQDMVAKSGSLTDKSESKYPTKSFDEAYFRNINITLVISYYNMGIENENLY
jgi:hypothetical protein